MPLNKISADTRAGNRRSVRRQMSTQSQWHFVGSVPENYERYLVPSIFAPWADDLVEAAGLQPGQRVLDIACGTGIVARTVARRMGSGDRVVGLDVSAPMLAAARSAAAAEARTIEWREGDAVRLPLADEAFDVAFCQQSFQFVPDRPAALREMYRVLAPGGKLVLSVWREIERSPGFAVLAQALTRHVSPDAGGLLRSGPFGLSSSEELRRLVAAAEFKDIIVRPATKVLRYPSSDEFVLRYAAGSALAGAVAGAEDNARAALLAEVAERLLQPYLDNQGLGFPIESNIVVARR
jgi:ubiquinone/menaquinone biosynthesis C-methylase UbiE